MDASTDMSQLQSVTHMLKVALNMQRTFNLLLASARNILQCLMVFV